MKVRITRTDVVHVEAQPGSPHADATLAQQLVAFRAAFTKSIFDDGGGEVTFETSDGEWLYDYVDHESVQMGFVPSEPPANVEEP